MVYGYMKTYLKPCPFCNGTVIKRIAPLMQTVMFVCTKCGADVCFTVQNMNLKQVKHEIQGL